MESESDTENEQLQHDILQIHEVLGQGDDDGDDSDSELETDDTKEADNDNNAIDEGLIEPSNESRSYTSSSLQQPVDKHYSQTTHQHQPSTSEESSLEQLLLINQESQRRLQELLFRVSEELERNQDEQVKVSNNPNNREEKNVDLSIIGLFRDYMELLKDGVGKKPPKNEDTKQRMSGDRSSPFESKQKKWSEVQRESLLEAVQTEGRKLATQPLLNRQEILEMKMDRMSIPEMLEKVYAEIENNKKELDKTESIPSEELLGDRFREVDWDTTANVYLEAERSAKECQLQWQNLLHPSISRKKWTSREKADLICIAVKHDYRNWEVITEELGTRRTALQCLRAFQLQDKNFVRPTFTDEEDALLQELAQHLQVGKYIPFPKVAYFMEGHTQLQVLYRWMRKLNPDIKTGKFSKEEDNKLKKFITAYGAKNWARLAELIPGRTQFQIRHRWMTVLAPSIKFGPWDYQETIEFLQKIKEHGVGNWSKIAVALKKNSGEKERTSYHLLQRFKNLVASYMTWRSNSSNPLWKIVDGDEEDLLGSQLADQLLAYLPLKQKAKEESRARRLAREEARSRKELEGVKKKKRRRKQKVQTSDDEDDEDDEEDEDDVDDEDVDLEVNNSGTQFLSKEQHLTARQKALAQRKELEQETVLVRQKSVVKDLDIKKNEKMLRHANKQLIMSRLDSMDKEISEQEEEEGTEDVDPYDARNEDDDDVAETHHGAGSSSGTTEGRIQKNTVSNHLSEWLQKLKDREAAQKETDVTEDKKGGINIPAGIPSTNYDPNGKGMPRWMEKLKHKERCITKRKTSGRKPYSEIDMELVKAVDPMWICRGKGPGRQRRQQLGMQKRTRQEKLSPNDQKMMFKLLLKVLDVDIEYASTKVRFSLQVSSEANARSQKTLPVIPTTPGTSDEAEAASVCQAGGTSALTQVNNNAQGVTSHPKAVIQISQLSSGDCEMRGVETRSSQTVNGSSQPVTLGHQEVTNGLPGVTNGPQLVAGGLPVVTVGPQVLIGSPRGLADGSSAVATGPFPVYRNPLGVNTGPHVVTSGHQVVTIGQQTVITGQPLIIIAPQRVTSDPHQVETDDTHSQNGGLQAVTSGPQILASHPQAVATGLQKVASGYQAVAGNFQAVASGPQGVTTVPQAVASGAQAVTNVSQAVASGPQAVASGAQAVTSILQAVASGPQAVASGPQAVASGPQAVASGPQAVTSIQQAVPSVPQTLASGPEAVTSVPQAETSVLQAVASGPQALTSVLQAVASGPQLVTSVSQPKTSDPQAVTSVLQAVASGPYALTSVPQAAASGPQAVPSDPRAVPSDPRAVASGPQAVTNVPHAVAFGSQAVTKVQQVVASGLGAVTNVPQAVASGLQAVAGDLQAAARGPQAVASGSQAVTNVPQAVASGLQAVAGDLQAAASGPRSVASGLPAEASNLQGNTSSIKSHEISTKTLSQNVIPHTVPPSTVQPEKATKDVMTSKDASKCKRGIAQHKGRSPQRKRSSSELKRGRALSVRKQLELQRGKIAQTASSSPESVAQNISNPTPLLSSPSNQVRLMQNLTPACISSPTHVQSGFNQNWPLSRGTNASQNQSEHPSLPQNTNTAIMPPAVTQRKLNLITNPLSIQNLGQVPNTAFGTLGVAPNQYVMFRDNQTGQVLLSQLPSALVQKQPAGLTSCPSQVRSFPPFAQNQGGPKELQSLLSGVAQKQNQIRSQPATIPTPITPGNTTLQGQMPPTTAIPPHDQCSAASTLQPMSQIMNPVVRGTGVDPPARQDTHMKSNTLPQSNANLRSLTLPNGTKLVITRDHLQSLQKGNLGNVTGHILTPLPCSHEKREKRESKKDQEHQAESKKNHTKLKKQGKCSKEQSEDTSTDSAKKDPPPIKKRKLHTKDISLLPPNIATIQALKSLLLDRKNLEERKNKYLLELEKQLIKSKEAKGEQTAHFSGYLEGRKSALEKTRETVVHPTTLISTEPGSFNNQEENVIPESQGQPNDVSPTGSKNDSEGLAKTTTPQELVEEHLSSLKKTDSYQLLERRFLSLFLWPGLLSSTRIKGMISVNLGDRDSYDEMPRKPKRMRKSRDSFEGLQPVVKKHANQSIHKNRNTAAVPSPTCPVTLESQRASEGLLQDQSVVEINGSNTNCNSDQYSANHAPSTSGHCVEKDATTNNDGVVPGNEGETTNYDHEVLARGEKRKAEDGPSSFCSHEEQRMREEEDDDSGIPQNKRRKVSESNYTDAMTALAALQNFDI